MTPAAATISEITDSMAVECIAILAEAQTMRSSNDIW
jgi:hypothetical protein